MSRFLSNRHKDLSAYVPGEQPRGLEYIKLNTNESPYPPSPGVIASVTEDELAKLRLYPDPDGSVLIQKIAVRYNVKPDNIIIGNGSDELLAFSFLAFCDKRRRVVFPDITYGFYPVYAELFGLAYEQIPLNDDFSVDPADYVNCGRNVVLANPNAPTGIALPLGDIEEITRSNPDHVVIIDEAYVDFGAQSAIGLLPRYENLLVIHTYSKSRSMAGARLSYAIGSERIVEDLNTMKYSFNPYNVNRLTQVMGAAAIEDEAYYAARRSEIAKTRGYTAGRLKELGFTMTDSKANFIFAAYPRLGGHDLYAALKEKGILVRHFEKPRISDYIRITIGTKEQMDALISAITEICGKVAGNHANR